MAPFGYNPIGSWSENLGAPQSTVRPRPWPPPLTSGDARREIMSVARGLISGLIYGPERPSTGRVTSRRSSESGASDRPGDSPGQQGRKGRDGHTRRPNGAAPQPDETYPSSASGFRAGSRRDLRSEGPTAATRYA